MSDYTDRLVAELKRMARQIGVVFVPNKKRIAAFGAMRRRRVSRKCSHGYLDSNDCPDCRH
jgi:hypothetical protein